MQPDVYCSIYDSQDVGATQVSVADEQIKWDLYTMECCSAMKGRLLSGTTWVDLEGELPEGNSGRTISLTYNLRNKNKDFQGRRWRRTLGAPHPRTTPW